MIPDEAYKIETRPLAIGGRTFAVSLYSVRYRKSGRRIVAREAGVTVYDTDNCYSMAEANNRFDAWRKVMECRKCSAEVDADDVPQDALSLEAIPLCAGCVADALAAPWPTLAEVAGPAAGPDTADMLAEVAKADGYDF